MRRAARLFDSTGKVTRKIIRLEPGDFLQSSVFRTSATAG